MSTPALKRVPELANAFDVEQTLQAVLDDFAATAVARDAAGGTAKRERDLLRASGLLGLSIPVELGGLGADLDETLHVTRRIARVDSSLAHLFAFHHFMLATLRFFGPREQWAPLLRDTASQRWFWGNALNPLDTGTTITPGSAGGHVVNGTKTYCSGATDADMLIVSALRPDQPGLVVAAIPGSRPGITIHNDWDNFGQRQTDSGRVTFTKMPVLDSEILRHPGPLGSPHASLRPGLGQLILVNLYLGIAEGALQEAISVFHKGARLWLNSKASSPAEDPFVLRNFGEYHVEIAGARALTDEAQLHFQAAVDKGDAITTRERGDVAIRIATAKVAASRAAVNVSGRLFEAVGARATTGSLRLDRFWRNARTHTLHDPLDYKLQEIGAFALSDQIPLPSFYS